MFASDACYETDYWPDWLRSGIPEDAMKPMDVYYFFFLGSVVGVMGEVEAGDNRARYRQSAALGVHHLRGLLSTPKGQGSVLASAIDEAYILKRESDAICAGDAQQVSEEEAKKVRTAYRAFSTAFRQVLLREPAFYPQRVGIFDTMKLVENADEALPQEIRDRVPHRALTDWKLAGKCLVFGLSSACGFHTVRSVETLIHDYYVQVTGDANMKRKDRNWGAYVRNLNRHLKMHPGSSKVDPKLVALIDQIREHHRNVVIHPEESLNQSQATILFSICLSAIISFVQEIYALEQMSGPKQTLLSKLIKPELGPAESGS